MKEISGRHSLGQNFLKDEVVLTNIVNSVNVTDKDKLIEIGPGMGALTKYLKEFGLPLTCFEIDLRTKAFLDKLVDKNTNIVYEDFMKVNLDDYFNKSDDYHVIANIPYYITTPIIEKLIDSNLNILSMTLMVQKEVGDRLSSLPGSSNYGYFTSYLNYYYDVIKLFDVDKKSFNPVPKVDSAVIKLVSNKHKCSNYDMLIKLMKDSFKMKRKNLKNNLKDYDLDKISVILNKYNHSLNNRAEDISIDEFIDIVNNY